jgi:hypothetical protein
MTCYDPQKSRLARLRAALWCLVAIYEMYLWCPEPESNRYGLRRGILSPLCLPISPSGLNMQAQRISWRRDPESNRGTRLCRPLHNHSAIAPCRTKNDQGLKRIGGKQSCFPPKIWSGRRVSNSRPIPWQGIALPTELLPQNGGELYLWKMLCQRLRATISGKALRR